MLARIQSLSQSVNLEMCQSRACCVQEAYRVIKPGGIACLIGPVHPTWPVSRFFADAWMLFPTEEEYMQWFAAAGFDNVQIKRIGPKWYRGVRRHGLIMGCSVTGTKRKVGSLLSARHFGCT
jgi:MPBQ/MSBQ methyltransferase